MRCQGVPGVIPDRKVGTGHNDRRKVMTEKPQETEGIDKGGKREPVDEKPQETEGIVKGGKREPVARDDEFPPPEGTQDNVIEETEEKPGGPRPL
jgi:hypothetical protein